MLVLHSDHQDITNCTSQASTQKFSFTHTSSVAPKAHNRLLGSQLSHLATVVHPKDTSTQAAACKESAVVCNYDH